MEIRIRVEDLASREFTAARRGLNAKVKEGLNAAGRAVLPTVRRLAPHVIQSSLITKATTKRMYVTTQGSKVNDRTTGLLNFGGIVTTAIAPKTEKAIAWGGPSGVVVSQVTTPRHYKGKHFIETGIAERMPAVEDAMESSVMEAFFGLSEPG